MFLCRLAYVNLTFNYLIEHNNIFIMTPYSDILKLFKLYCRLLQLKNSTLKQTRNLCKNRPDAEAYLISGVDIDDQGQLQVID